MLIFIAWGLQIPHERVEPAMSVFFPPLSGELEGASSRGLTRPTRGLTPPPMLYRPKGLMPLQSNHPFILQEIAGQARDEGV